jgi:CPA2 family monovalent cation:H+ antiporter-2
MGIAFSLSSTAVAIKTLSDRGELETLNGEMVAGWVFMQDLFTVPLFLILPVIGGLMTGGPAISIASVFMLIRTLFFACILFWIILLSGRRIIPMLMEKIAELKNRELVTIAAVSICFLFSLLFQFLGFSFAVGAFVAGIMMASSSAKWGIFSEIRPLRDLFSVVFFVSLGFLLDPAFLFQHVILIMAIVIIMIILKSLISALLIVVLGYHAKTAIVVSLSLLTISEFAFILALTLLDAQLITPYAYNVILSVTLLSLLIGVFPSFAGSRAYYAIKTFMMKFFPFSKRFFEQKDIKGEIQKTAQNHIIVLGYGRVGKYICRALTFVGAQFLVVDFDHRTVRRIRQEGIQAIYGDPADPNILISAGIQDAKAIILAYPDRMMQEEVVMNIFNLNKRIQVLCRTHFEEDQKKLRALGVHTIVQPEFEAAITLTEKILKLCNIAPDEIEGKITRLKIEHGS